MATVYVLKNNANAIIEICDDANNAAVLKDNLVKTGEYRSINVEEYELNSDTISPLEVLKISGVIDSNGGLTLRVAAYNPSSKEADDLKFTVNASNIQYTGVANLTDAEKSLVDMEAIQTRIKKWVREEFKERLENDNQ